MTRRLSSRMRRGSMWFKYAVRRNLTLPRNFILAESYRRFWRGHPLNSAVLEASQVQDLTGAPCR
jgi:hypothetical protein